MENSNQITVIGLGSMGFKLAELLIEQGWKVTVWNRTKAKAEPLIQKGAVLASSPAEAVAASPVTVVCVYDYQAASEILETPEVAAVLTGRALIQLTTGSPNEATRSEAWAHKFGANYLDGAIQAAPSQMAQPDTVLLVSGSKGAYEISEPILKVFGGTIKYLGEKASLASALDNATLSSLYGALIGFFHGIRICEAEGFDIGEFAAIMAEIVPTFSDFLLHEGKVVQSGDFTTTESPLRISAEATARMAQTAKDLGINSEFPTFLAHLFQRAVADGYANEELAAVVKSLR